MQRPAFIASEGSVWWSPDARQPIRLGDQEVETLLGLFAQHDDPTLFNSLNSANVAAGGVERVSPFRKAA